MSRKQFAVVALFASLAAFAGAFVAGSVLKVSAASAQHAYFDSIASRKFVLIHHTGALRGQMLEDARGSAVIELGNSQGIVGLRLAVDQNGLGMITDGQGRPLTAPRPSLPPLQPPNIYGGKEDSASTYDIRFLQYQVDELHRSVNELIARVNALS